MSTRNGPIVIIGVITLTTATVLYLVNKGVSESDLVHKIPADYGWIVHGFVNILGYATILLPGYFTYKYIQKINYINRNGNTCFGKLFRMCFGEEESSIPNINNPASSGSQRSECKRVVLLLFYFCGLQVSYLSWGVLQEKVMTQEYHNSNGEVGHFKDSQFLVFVNRILAFSMSGMYLLWQRQPRHRCPLYKYVFCSLSNIMSSWCQYEALKYVSFPHQVLAKAAKTIPVMIMGKIVSRTKYEYYEYVTAVILSIGMVFFMLDAGNDRATSRVTTFSGAILLISYIAFDSFTANWQGTLFKSYHMKPIQMMCFVNLYSCIFTAVSLFQQGGFVVSLNFMTQYPSFVLDCILLSICSAGGQLFIFSTISEFGPFVFAIITTIRQGFSVLLSCLIFHHQVNALGIFGVILVFLGVLLKIYCSYRLKKIRSVNQTKILP